MDDPLLMGRRQATRHLDRDVQRLARGEMTVPEPLPQRLAVEQLGDDLGPAVIGAYVMNDEDVGVVEGGDDARFLLEAALAFRVGGERGRKHLHGDLPVEARVPRPEHLAHPTRSEGSPEDVRTESRAVRQRSGRRPCHMVELRPRWGDDRQLTPSGER